ncbi:MAG: cytoplasmic protein [Nitratireductor sp.]|nr:cytoplasmic protein [Nitratireductor sp.]
MSLRMLMLAGLLAVMPISCGTATAQEAGTETADPDAPGHSRGEQLRTQAAESAIPDIRTDLSTLPFPVRKMRELLLEAARSGDIEKLRPYIGEGNDKTILSFGGLQQDPITFLKEASGDGEGYEILAILIDLLETGFVRIEADTENELYVWPYFYSIPIDKLTPQQSVEMYRVLTHGDYEEMKDFGAYVFYRVGITPQGRWRFFVAGD